MVEEVKVRARLSLEIVKGRMWRVARERGARKERITEAMMMRLPAGTK